MKKENDITSFLASFTQKKEAHEKEILSIIESDNLKEKYSTLISRYNTLDNLCFDLTLEIGYDDDDDLDIHEDNFLDYERLQDLMNEKYIIQRKMFFSLTSKYGTTKAELITSKLL